jgi:hypothetical protein
MPKKVIPFPPRKAAGTPPVTPGHSRIMIHIGTQRYAEATEQIDDQMMTSTVPSPMPAPPP